MSLQADMQIVLKVRTCPHLTHVHLKGCAMYMTYSLRGTTAVVELPVHGRVA